MRGTIGQTLTADTTVISAATLVNRVGRG